jgi:hypothetical protein
MARMIRNTAVGMLCGIIFAFLTVVPALAQGNQPHFELVASITADDLVKLDWVPTANLTFNYFLVFRAALDSNALIQMDQATFEQIDSVAGTVTSVTDSPPLEQSHIFAYVVRGITSGSQEIRSTVAIVNYIGRIKTGDEIKIHTMPPDRATIGTEYRYQVGATSSDSGARLMYQLAEGPAGMSMDSAGLVRWTPGPGQVGWFQAGIRVTSDKGGGQMQRWQIGVGAGSGIVQGYVKEAVTGTPIQWVMVKLYQRHLNRHYEYRAITDVHGFYKMINVDTATYLIRAVPLRPDYIGQWYDGVKYVQDATPVTVPDALDPNGGITTVNFNLLPTETDRPHFTASGKVTDGDGVPIPNAWVGFARPEFALNASREYGNGFMDGGYDRDCFDPHNFNYSWQYNYRFDGNSRWVFKTMTDASGEYSIRLPLGFYVALARAPGYVPVFYDGKTDLLSADVIPVDADVAGIDFALPSVPPVALGGISGLVRAENGDTVMARMVAFRDCWSLPEGPACPRAFFTDTDTAGAYAFSELPPGTYYVLALPLGHYAPSFYSTGGPTIRWTEATPIVIDGNAISGIDIAVKPMVRWAFGYTWMHGNVYANAYANGVPATPGNQSGPLAGAFVYAMNDSGAMAGYGITGPNGSYRIEGLAPGTYRAMVVRAGFIEGTSLPVSPTYDSSLDPVPAQANLDLTVTGTTEPRSMPNEFTVGQNYPNPFNPSTAISFGLPRAARVTIVVYNILGQQVARLVDEIRPAGTYQVMWDGTDQSGKGVASGVYLYRVSADEFSATRKMALVR